MARSYEHVKGRQKALNRWTRQLASWLDPLEVDGIPGPLYERRISEVKYLVGWTNPDHRNSEWTDCFEKCVLRPGRRVKGCLGAAGAARGIARRRAFAAAHKANQLQGVFTRGVGRFDGKAVAKAAIPFLTFAREHGWAGYLVSGYRAPWYSRLLCQRMCGHDSCPGTCAGVSSNHVGDGPERFAIDVSDYYTFARLMRVAPFRYHIFNALGARDPVHFSPSGR